jgi:PAS domain S-box-containing protein
LIPAAITLVAAVAVAALLALWRMRTEVDETAKLATATARAGVLMARSLDASETLADVVHVLVPDVSDWAAVHLVADHGGIARAAFIHCNPTIHAEIERVHQLFAVNPNRNQGPAHVIRTGQSSFVARLSREALARAGEQFSEYGDLLSTMIGGSAIIVPLRSRGGTVGSLTIGRNRRRPYTKAHLAWAEDLGHRLGLSIENARLYSEARQLFEQTVSANYVSTPDGRILAANQTFADLLGFQSPDEVLQHPAHGFYVHPDERERSLATLRKDGRLVGYESTIRRSDGTPVSIAENAVGTFDERGELVKITGYVLDRTNVKNLEEQLRQSQRLEAVGQLAGGIAHDFNNLLTVIIGCADLMKDDHHRAVVEGHDPLEELMKAAKRAAGLTQQLLAFGRRQVLLPRVLDLNASLQSVHGMLRRLVRENIVLTLNLDPDIAPVRVDPGQLDQVVVNLVVNGGDAMPKGGSITLTTANLAVTEAHVAEYPFLKPGAYVSLVVGDTGAGMDQETRARAFEPFFTTKPVGKGTGLGLSTVYGIVKQSGGYVWIDSEIDRGTTVTVCLPIAKAD